MPLYLITEKKVGCHTLLYYAIVAQYSTLVDKLVFILPQSMLSQSTSFSLYIAQYTIMYKLNEVCSYGSHLESRLCWNTQFGICSKLPIEGTLDG